MVPAEYTYKTQVYILSSISTGTTVTRRSITQVVILLRFISYVYVHGVHI